MHLQFWKDSGNKKILVKIFSLIDAVALDPYNGLGKPEALKENYSGYWSRRINKEHRMVYRIEKDIIYIFVLKGHYTE